MSSGPVCHCEEAAKPIAQRDWVITARHCNHSAFNGYRREYSAWSAVVCRRCHAGWRTKATYVHHLKDNKP